MDFYSSGLENIYLRGMRLGFTRLEMNKHVDDIIDFTELGEDIYRPVRTYSSGMLARLSFGIATSFMADIYFSICGPTFVLITLSTNFNN